MSSAIHERGRDTAVRQSVEEWLADEGVELRLADILRALHDTCTAPGARVLLDGKPIYPDEIFINADGELSITTLHPAVAERRAFQARMQREYEEAVAA